MGRSPGFAPPSLDLGPSCLMTSCVSQKYSHFSVCLIMGLPYSQPDTLVGANSCIISSNSSKLQIHPKLLVFCGPNLPEIQLFVYFWLDVESSKLRDAWKNKTLANCFSTHQKT